MQIVEALALPEGDPVYEVSVRGWGWQKEGQEVRAGAVPAMDEVEIQVRSYERYNAVRNICRSVQPFGG